MEKIDNFEDTFVKCADKPSDTSPPTFSEDDQLVVIQGRNNIPSFQLEPKIMALDSGLFPAHQIISMDSPSKKNGASNKEDRGIANLQGHPILEKAQQNLKGQLLERKQDLEEHLREKCFVLKNET